MSKLVVLAPVPAPLVSQWLISKSGRSDIEVFSIEGSDEAAAKQALAETEIVLGDYTFARGIDAEFLAGAPKLRFVQQPSVGYQHIDLEACHTAGVAVANTPGVNAVAVAEHTLMLAIMLLRKAIYAHQQTSQGEWPQQELLWERGVFELLDKTFGIVGMGRVGRELASRLAPFGTRTLYYDPVRLPEADEAELKVQYKPLDHVLRLADVVSLHVPLTDETRGLMNDEKLALMKFNAVLINVARGECIDEVALAKRIREKKLAGAGIDVFTAEPIVKDHPLMGLDNVIFTPHIAGATAEVRERVIHMAIDNVARVLRGEDAQYVLNPTS